MNPSTLYTAYRELFQAVTDNFVTQKPQELATLFPQIGKNYVQDHPIRFMVVGRCLNGWDKGIISSYKNADDFAKDACEQIAPSDSLDQFFHAYNTNRSAFWRTTKSIVHGLYAHENQVLSDPWQDSIIWMNLFPVAPKEGGNPGARLLNAQREAAKTIFASMAAFCKPTHILCMTDWAYWVHHKKGEMIDSSMMSIPESDKGWICRSGYIDESKVVISKRPECKKEALYTNQVIDAFLDI